MFFVTVFHLFVGPERPQMHSRVEKFSKTNRNTDFTKSRTFSGGEMKAQCRRLFKLIRRKQMIFKKKKNLFTVEFMR